jgi:hypothetical protein
MRTCLQLVVISSLLFATIGRADDDPPGEKAIQEAIKDLQAKKTLAANEVDRDKIDQAIAALEKVVAKPAAAPSPVPGAAPDAHPQLTPEVLYSKLHGRVAYDARTGELTLTYNFLNPNQIKDFELGRGSRVKMANGTLFVGGSERYTHVVPFKTVRVTADVEVVNGPLGFYVGTTQDLQLYIHDNWSIEMWLDGVAASRKPLPLGQWNKLLHILMVVEEKRIALQAGAVVLGGAITDKPRGGKVIVQGGHNDGALFHNLVIKGEPDPEWLRTFFKK